jgi:hypothetical protein
LFLLHRRRQGPGRTTRAGTIHFRVLPLGSSTRSSDLSLLFPLVTNRYSHRMRVVHRSSSFCSTVSNGSDSGFWLEGRTHPCPPSLLIENRPTGSSETETDHHRDSALPMDLRSGQQTRQQRESTRDAHACTPLREERARKEETTFTFPLAVTTFPLAHQVVHHRQLLLLPPLCFIKLVLHNSL